MAKVIHVMAFCLQSLQTANMLKAGSVGSVWQSCEKKLEMLIYVKANIDEDAGSEIYQQMDI